MPALQSNPFKEQCGQHWPWLCASSWLLRPPCCRYCHCHLSQFYFGLANSWHLSLLELPRISSFSCINSKRQFVWMKPKLFRRYDLFHYISVSVFWNLFIGFCHSSFGHITGLEVGWYEKETKLNNSFSNSEAVGFVMLWKWQTYRLWLGLFCTLLYILWNWTR